MEKKGPFPTIPLHLPFSSFNSGECYSNHWSCGGHTTLKGPSHVTSFQHPFLLTSSPKRRLIGLWTKWREGWEWESSYSPLEDVQQPDMHVPAATE